MKLKAYTLATIGLSLPLAAIALKKNNINKPALNDKPNVIIVYVDDLGYGDISCYGNSLVETPNIDFLCKNGIKFTQNYVMQSVSAPSRVGLMTGAYPTRLGMDANSSKNFTIESNHKLLPEAFKESGYRTGICGKWNVPVRNDNMFDFIQNRINFAANYWPDENGIYNGVDNSKTPNLQNGLWKDGSNGEKYLTDMVFGSAVEFINQTKSDKKPFFLYLAPNAPHYPLQAHKRYLEKVQNIKNPAYQTYAAMILALDDNLGKMLDALRINNQMENTIIVFSSDNGPSTASKATNEDTGAGGKTWYWPENWPTGLKFYSTNGLRGAKGDLFEGGIRLPMIMYYPKQIKAGSVCNTPVPNIDIYPTLCKMSNIKVPNGIKLDGKEITDLIYGLSDENPHEYIFWKMRDQGAVRKGDWKLYFSKKNGIMLFNIKKDEKEETNISEQYPDITAELQEKWNEWFQPYKTIFYSNKEEEQQRQKKK